MQTKKMPTVLNRELQRALITLRTAGDYGVTYMVRTPTGMVTNIPEDKPAEKPTGKRSPKGTLEVYYKDIVIATKAGDIKEIKAPKEVDINHLRGAISGTCTRLWGPDAHTTHVNRKMQTIELYRFK